MHHWYSDKKIPNTSNYAEPATFERFGYVQLYHRMGVEGHLDQRFVGAVNLQFLCEALTDRMFSIINTLPRQIITLVRKLYSKTT